MEEWRDVPGWEGFYQVSNEGRVRSLNRVTDALDCVGNPCLRRQRGKLLRAGVGKNGYAVVCFTRPGGKRLCAYVHRLVALAFLGPVPEGHEVCHNDGVKAHNHASNIRYDTRSSNALDRHIHGTMNQARGESHFYAKLTADNVRWIRHHAGGYTHREMALIFGVSHGTIGSVTRRKHWAHLD